ncbi:MAG TPA: YdeI/OmpD-associated family protein [Chitinophagaceae bacterium]|nr:YdeI/OmpD-associated family protein [Chitinophagaceae bacterium]
MKPLVNKTVLLEKFPGKGGWTYGRLPGVKPDPHAHFGWIKVRGFIDDFEIRQYHLMPMGNGELFLPVRAEIRKKIRKNAGDTVKVVLYRDVDEVFIPEELQDCLDLEPTSKTSFEKLSAEEKTEIIKWIYSLKNAENRANRIAELMKKNWVIR